MITKVIKYKNKKITLSLALFVIPLSLSTGLAEENISCDKILSYTQDDLSKMDSEQLVRVLQRQIECQEKAGYLPQDETAIIQFAVPIDDTQLLKEKAAERLDETVEEQRETARDRAIGEGNFPFIDSSPN